MIRFGLASVFGFVLIYVESVIVMHLKGLATIEFSEIAPFIDVWAMNFFLVFAILTQIGNWFQTRGMINSGEKNNVY